MLRKTTLTILLLGVVFTAISQSYNVRNYSVNDGLAQNYVAIMLEDSEGYLWFGTMDGLCRFDGYEFTVFRNIPGDTTSIADGDVTALHEDSQGFIWIVMRDGDIDVYDRRNQSFFHLSSIPGFPEKHMITEAYEICLLYTSPSPRDEQSSRMPSSA